jgi:hypothetical protein
MPSACYAEILRQEGFRLIGELSYRLRLSVWWHPDAARLLEILVVSVGDSALIKANKTYYIQSVAAAGETWARDIGQLHDYLEAHFPELRISFSHFRDVPPQLATQEVRRRMSAETQRPPTLEEIAKLQQRMSAVRDDADAMDQLLALSPTADLLNNYVRRQAQPRRHEIQRLKSQIEKGQERIELFRHLQREFERKGSAAVYGFSISSNLQTARGPQEFLPALQSAVRELADLHRYQIVQKLQGGRLNIHVIEAREPAFVWIEQWLGGALSPRQLQTLGPEFDVLKDNAATHAIVTPDEAIMVDGRVRHAEKHLSARFVSDALHRLDKTEDRRSYLRSETVRPEAMPLALGNRVDQSGRALGLALFPLAEMAHTYISGTTGSGKSFLARVLIEEATRYNAVNVLVLDPRNQSVGLLMAEDRPAVLERYPQFDMPTEAARALNFQYFAPALPFVPALPANLQQLATGRSIVSFKDITDRDRCECAAQILNAAFAACATHESEYPRLLIVVDEAHRFTRKKVEDCAKDSALKTERAIELIAREGRKFGIVLAIVSQRMADFGYDLASIRQMTSTKLFLRNSDTELQYAADILEDNKALVHLPTGIAIAHNAERGMLRVRIRPPWTKVFEPTHAEINALFAGASKRPVVTSHDAKRLLSLITEANKCSEQPLNLSQIAQLTGITSKRRLHELIDELEQAGAIRTQRRRERGRPRVIVPVL